MACAVLCGTTINTNVYGMWIAIEKSSVKRTPERRLLRVMRVLCFDLTYLCNKDENRWNDEFFVSEDLIHRFPSVDEHTHGLGFDDWVTITCLNYQNLPEIEHQNAARHWSSSSANQGLQFLLWRHRGARSRGGSRSVSLIASEKIASTTAGTEDISSPRNSNLMEI